MFHQIRKYRNFLAVAFLAFYMAGGLQFSVLECLHFISHIDEMVEGKYAKHHFHLHSADHQHIALTTFEAQTNHDRKSTPVNETSDVSSKKSPQLIYPNQVDFYCLVELIRVVYPRASRLLSFQPSVPSPPPRA